MIEYLLSVTGFIEFLSEIKKLFNKIDDFAKSLCLNF